jgi:hypothetical protein
VALRLPTSLAGWLGRAGVSLVIAAIGVATALGCDHYWQSQIPPQQVVGGGYPPITAPAFGSVVGDLLFGALPFVVLAAAVLLFGGRVFVVLALAFLVVLTIWEYLANATDSSSTAALVFLGSWSFGLPVVLGAVFADAAWRSRRAARTT